MTAAKPATADDAGARRATERYDILDTPPEAAFDRLTNMAACIFNVPMSVLDIAHGDREFFKARHGIGVTEIARDQSLCAHLLGAGEVMVVGDARKDLRFADKQLVTGPTAIRFYAGAPLTTGDGFNVGSISIADTVPGRQRHRAQEADDSLAESEQRSPAWTSTRRWRRRRPRWWTA